MITTFYPPYGFGGDAVFVQRLARALARRGHAVDVIHSVDSFKVLGGRMPSTSPPAEPGITVHSLASRLGGLAPLAAQQTGFPLFYGRRIRAILAAGCFDVIHFHNPSLVGGPGLLRYGDAVKLYTTHEHWLVCPTHVLFKFKQEPCERRACLRCQIAHHRPPQWWRYTGLLRDSVRHLDAIIAPSAFTLRRHQASGLDVRMVSIPPFIEPGPELPDPDCRGIGGLALPPGPFFLFVGRLERLKGLHTIIPAFVRQQRASLVVVGDGDDLAALRALAGGSDQVRFLGKLATEDVQALYARAVATIIPSITYEVFPLVVAESLARGTPVVARDLGSLGEIVRATRAGLTFTDPTELMAQIHRLLDEPGLRDRLAGAARAAYRERWTEAAHMREYLGLVEQIMNARASRARGR
jgi:glycosyltransferase involved in cell wall biosynthesis